MKNLTKEIAKKKIETKFSKSGFNPEMAKRMMNDNFDDAYKYFSTITRMFEYIITV